MANPSKVQATVSSIIHHGDKVYTILLTPEKKVPRFKPGQFLHLTIDPFDPQGGFWPNSRVFSIASHPSDSTIKIIYSVKGAYTLRMSHELCEGARVWLKLPYGNFTINADDSTHHDICLIAGGTGISPYLSYLSTKPSNPAQKIHLIYGIRKKSLLLCEDILFERVTESSNFILDIFLEHFEEQPLIRNRIMPRHGQISFQRIEELKRILKDPLFYISGPPTMISKFKTLLLNSSCAADSIKIDEWE